ncbi:MAG TPA: LamG-like jellyroll fold domain-containing protein [Flavipsychrobacter sp.]
MKKVLSIVTCLVIIASCNLYFSTILHAQQIPTSGLLAHWPFSGNANDVHGSHHGNPNNITPVQGKMGANNTAYLFNGVNDYIGIPYQSSMNVSAISMCAIFKADAFYTNTCQGNFILSRGAQGSNGSLILDYLDNTYNSCAVADTNAYTFAGQVGPTVLPATTNQSPVRVHTQTWYCFVLTYDGTTAKYYVNGTLINSFTGWSSTIGSSTDSICIGKYPWGGTGYPYNFIGVLDDVAIYNRSLSTTEIDSYCVNAPKVGIPVDSADTSVTVRYIDDISNKVRLYPSPNNGRFTINGTLNSKSAELVIYNMVGTIVHRLGVTVKGTVVSNDIDISALPAGMYMLRIAAGDYMENIRFVKKE